MSTSMIWAARYDVVVIGSGTGGSCAALRLAEKGYAVAVLEAGPTSVVGLLARAAAEGASVHPCVTAWRVRRTPGGYAVDTLGTGDRRRRRTFKGREVVFAAGAAGTPRLLRAMRAEGALPHLSPVLADGRPVPGRRPFRWAPGGSDDVRCPVAGCPEEGVVDSYCRVFGHPGLHVLDGSLIGDAAPDTTTRVEAALACWPDRGAPDPRPPLAAAGSATR